MSNTEEILKAVIPGRLIRVSDEAARVSAPGSSPPAGQPRVEMVREGDVLRAIDVVCGCGKRIRLRCVYEQ
ncbi:MAG TPA: hypothetical protein VE988_25175 [Gemmataceae bacterium]|nr:hypothetical protein [Gemmataceae bacterium]